MRALFDIVGREEGISGELIEGAVILYIYVYIYGWMELGGDWGDWGIGRALAEIYTARRPLQSFSVSSWHAALPGARTG